MSRLVVGQLQAADPSTNLIGVASGDTVYSPGSVVQMVNTYQVDPYSIGVSSTYNATADLTGLAATITPKSASSKIYMVVRWFGEYNPLASMGWNTMFNVKRNGTLIGQPPQPGTLTLGITIAALSYYSSDSDSTPEMAMFDYMDSPNTTSATTYQVCVSSNSGGTMFVNRCVNAATSGGYERGTSSITLWEIAQ